MSDHVGFTRITSSNIINEGATLLYGLLLLVSVASGDISLYEGLDASSGRLIAKIQGVAAVTLPIKFDQPLYLDRGLYVAIGSNVTETTILWMPAGA